MGESGTTFLLCASFEFLIILNSCNQSDRFSGTSSNGFSQIVSASDREYHPTPDRISDGFSSCRRTCRPVHPAFAPPGLWRPQAYSHLTPCRPVRPAALAASSLDSRPRPAPPGALDLPRCPSAV